MQTLKNISFILGVLVMSLLVGFLAFAWTDAPVGDPPSCSEGHTGCSNTPLNLSIYAQEKQGPLVLATNSGLSIGLIVQHGKVGIGKTNPKSKLDIDGAVQIGSEEECNAVKEGTIRYNSSVESFEGCDGNAWVLIADLRPCGDIISVTFTYKGSSEIYNTVASAGKCWLDRNLGASRVAEAFDDESAYGDLFQWGRLDDKHQDRNSTLTTTLSTKDVPGHAKFIYKSDDWRNPSNENLWQGVGGINNPCPPGWRVPTMNDWENEIATWEKGYDFSSNPLKLPTRPGKRQGLTGNISIGGSPYYWTTGSDGEYGLLVDLGFTPSSSPSFGWIAKTYGFPIRCIKD